MEAFIKDRTVRKTNKTNEVLKHLREKGSITSMDAFRMYGATRLSAIIFTLRKRGFDIQNKSKSGLDRYGNRCDYVEYIFKGDSK